MLALAAPHIDYHALAPEIILVATIVVYVVMGMIASTLTQPFLTPPPVTISLADATYLA